jgi:hypothetical protein
MHGYQVLTSVECTTVMTAALMVTSGLGSSLDWWVWELVLLWMGLSLGETCHVVRQHGLEIGHESRGSMVTLDQ